LAAGDLWFNMNFDINSDGVIDAADLIEFGARFGTGL
jgi:hypothetical protein